MEPKNNSGTKNPAAGKYEAAVAKATGAPSPSAAEEGTAALVPLHGDAKAMIGKPSQDQINALMADGALEFAPMVHSLETGEMITGILEGRGPTTTFSQINPSTRNEEVREVDTWILRHPTSGFRLSILSSVQLDRKLPPFIGDMVTIYRGEERKTLKGFRVTDYTVAGPKRADGKMRSWTRSEIIDASSRTIDGPSDMPQLTSGSTPTATQGGEDATA